VINRPIPAPARCLFFTDRGLQLICYISENIPTLSCVAPRFLATSKPSYPWSCKSHTPTTVCRSNYTIYGVRLLLIRTSGKYNLLENVWWISYIFIDCSLFSSIRCCGYYTPAAGAFHSVPFWPDFLGPS
jgi:hypothetical protein